MCRATAVAVSLGPGGLFRAMNPMPNPDEIKPSKMLNSLFRHRSSNKKTPDVKRSSSHTVVSSSDRTVDRRALQNFPDCAANPNSRRRRFLCARYSGGERAHVLSGGSSRSSLRSQQTMATIMANLALTAFLAATASAFVATPGPALGVSGGHHHFRPLVSETNRAKSAFQASIILAGTL